MNLRTNGMWRIGRPYAPLAIAAMFFLLITAVVSPEERSEESLAATVEVPLGPGNESLDPQNPQEPGDGAGEQGPGAGPDTSGQTPTGEPGSSSTQPGSQTTQGGGVQRCPDRAEQVPGDPYSPPCLTFSGDNGGATHTGVSKDEIVVTLRELEGPSAAEIFSDISGENVSSSREAVLDTINALGEYFSKHYQFYGRKVTFKPFKGEGNGASELLGGGRDKALADAVQASQMKPFADLSAITIPYADALSRQKIVNIGSPYPSRTWFNERSPYAWALFPDGDVVVEASVDWIVGRLLGQDTAEYAGPGLQGKARVYGLVAPENPEYQQSVDRYVGLVEAAGFKITKNLKYKLDISSMPNQASNIIAQLKDAGVTSVICACDPVMLALGMAPKANEQDYEPEWLTGGLAFVDQDIVAQLIDTRQWQRAFGLAFNAEQEPLGASFPYRAYKTMRPNGEPAFGVEEIYYQMLIFALGVHMAGPNLTPETFQAGLYSYPGGQGVRGHWSFGPGDHTPTDDVREIWWDPDKISRQNNKPGSWIELNGGARYFPGQIPRQPAPYFER